MSINTNIEQRYEDLYLEGFTIIKEHSFSDYWIKKLWQKKLITREYKHDDRCNNNFWLLNATENYKAFFEQNMMQQVISKMRREKITYGVRIDGKDFLKKELGGLRYFPKSKVIIFRTHSIAKKYGLIKRADFIKKNKLENHLWLIYAWDWNSEDNEDKRPYFLKYELNSGIPTYHQFFKEADAQKYIDRTLGIGKEMYDQHRRPIEI